MEEKDLFDLFREESENLIEQPRAETWQRLEKRLVSSHKRRQKRKPVPTQWLVVTAMMVLIAIVGGVSWVVTREHEAILRGQKQYASLAFLKGRWTASEGKTGDELVFETTDSMILRGVKTLTFKDILVANDTFLIQNKGKNTVFRYKKQDYYLKNNEHQAFKFLSADGSAILLRQSADNRFTLSFGEGVVFVYKRI